MASFSEFLSGNKNLPENVKSDVLFLSALPPYESTLQLIYESSSIHESGPSAALIDKEAFIDLLQREKLAPIWIVAGEKGAYGEHHDDFVGRRVHSFVYELNQSNTIVCTRQHVMHERRDRPVQAESEFRDSGNSEKV